MITRNGDTIFGMISFGMSMSTQNPNNRIRNINNSTCYSSGSSLSNTYLNKIASPIDFYNRCNIFSIRIIFMDR